MDKKIRRYLLLLVGGSFIIWLMIGALVLSSSSQLNNYLFNTLRRKLTSHREQIPSATNETAQTNAVILTEKRSTDTDERFLSLSGKLVSVKDRTIVLESNKNKLQVVVASKALIQQLTPPSNQDPVPHIKQIKLNDIPIGTRVDALVEVISNQSQAVQLNVIKVQ